MSPFNRRSFMQAGAVVTAGALAKKASAAADVNSTIRAAVLGVNGRGKAHINMLGQIEGVKVVVLCDPDEVVLGTRAEEFETKYGYKVETATDMRTVFDRDDIDVVTIATPNHWHALATIWACQAGKDVLVEKPGTHNLSEGPKMIAAAKKYKRIVQHGVQLRSNPELKRAVELMKDGVIGDVYMARAVVYRIRASIGKKPNSPPPKTLDWDLWQGPAAERDFSGRLVHYNWHWHWDYGNGDIGNQGVHEIDMCHWGLNATVEGDLGLPSEVSAIGGKFLWDDDRETPEVLSAGLVYPEQKKMIGIEVRPWMSNDEAGVKVGNIFYGKEGYLLVKGYNSFATYLGSKQEPGPFGDAGDPLLLHFQNFIDAVRDRDPGMLNGPLETAHTSSGIAHLANMSHRLGRRLRFDPATGTFPDDPEANAFSERAYRDPFTAGDDA